MTEIKKEKKKLKKLAQKLDSDDDGSDHELSYYMDDRVKLMKEVLKIIKPKKIKAMAPHCLKHLKIDEINSMLLEELLGISNKRLKCIFDGQNLEEDSTDPEEEKSKDKTSDIISLDDISEDDFIDLDSDKEAKNKRKHHIKGKSFKKKIKREKKEQPKAKADEESLMSVLELLELQARARAIRSQLLLEQNKKDEPTTSNIKVEDSDNEEDAVIIEVPKTNEIVITSSESENEQESAKQKGDNDQENIINVCKEMDKNLDKNDKVTSHAQQQETITSESKGVRENQNKTDGVSLEKENVQNSNINKIEESTNNKVDVICDSTSSATEDNKNDLNAENEHSATKSSHEEGEGIVLNVDESEMDCIICD